jgi:hypothetical protein
VKEEDEVSSRSFKKMERKLEGSEVCEVTSHCEDCVDPSHYFLDCFNTVHCK